MVRAENPSCARIRSNDKKYKKEEEEMTEHEYTDTYYYKKEEKERQSKQKQDGMNKSLYRIVSVLVAVIGSICFLLAAFLYLFSNIIDMIASVYRGISSCILTLQNTVSKRIVPTRRQCQHARRQILRFLKRNIRRKTGK